MVRGTIAIPRADHFTIPWYFAYSLIILLRHCDRIWGPGSVKLQVVEGSLIEENRAALLNLTEGDWILMLDTDMKFDHDLAEKLDAHIQEGKDMVTALYFLGYDRAGPGIYPPDLNDQTPAYRYTNYPKDATFEVGGCGMATTIISRKVVDDFKNNQQVGESFKRMHKLGKMIGEDLSFCYRVREKGYKIWCDSSLKVGHLRPYAITDEQPYIKI